MFQHNLIPFFILLLISLHLAYSLPNGYLDITTLGADPTGATDSTNAFKTAITTARSQQLVIWLPAGTYRVSERLEAQQDPTSREHYPIVFNGPSTTDPSRRALIVLSANSPGFNDPVNRRTVLHIFKDGPPETEGGTGDLFNHGVVSVDFRIEAGNAGAVALRLQGAEGTTIQDVRIDLTAGGHTGIWGIPGSGGSTHSVSVTGGKYGIDTRSISTSRGGTQPQAVVTNAILKGQAEAAVFGAARGALVLVGSYLERGTAGALVRALFHWHGQPFEGSLHFVDCELVYSNTPAGGNVVFDMPTPGPGRSFALENSFVRNADKVYEKGSTAVNGSVGWVKFKRLALHVKPFDRFWGSPSEPVWVNGQLHGDLYNERSLDTTPSATLLTQHALPQNPPMWYSPGVADVTTLGAVGDGVFDNTAVLQNAINTHEKLFFPKGVYKVSDTLQLLPSTKIIGVYHEFSAIQAISTTASKFGGVTTGQDKPIIRTADVANGDTYIAFIHIRRTFPLSQHSPTAPGNFALEWRTGGRSVMRQVAVQYRPSRNLRPDFILKLFYKQDITPNVFHPQKDFPAGMYAWPNDHPNVLINGNGGGRIFGFWCHGRQGMREDTPFLMIKDTVNPLHMYHVHLQQQDSRNLAEVINSKYVTIYGTKGEHKGSQVLFKDSSHVRLIGHGGMGTPDKSYNPPYLFRFLNCQNFLISGVNDYINEHTDNWIGGIYDKWIHANIFNFYPIQDSRNGNNIVVPSAQRPIMYLVGDPIIPPLPIDDTPPLPTPTASTSVVASVSPTTSLSPSPSILISVTSSPSSIPSSSSSIPALPSASITPTSSSLPSTTPSASGSTEPLASASSSVAPTQTPSVSPDLAPSSSPIVAIQSVNAGNLNYGIAFTDPLVQVYSTWYIMYSKQSLKNRFSSYELHPNAADHLVGVRYDSTQNTWMLDRGMFPDPPNPEFAFVPEDGDRLLAKVDFFNGNIQMLQGQSGNIMGIPTGYHTTNMEFFINMWNGNNNEYEVWAKGSSFSFYTGSIPDSSMFPSPTPSPISNTFMVGDLKKGVGFTDPLVLTHSTWYIMYSEESIATRFPTAELHPDAATNLVGVRYDSLTNTWMLDRGMFADPPNPDIPFTPVSGDRLLSKVNFYTGSVVDLKGTVGNVMGIPSGYAESDLEFYPNMWDGKENLYEVWVTGTYFKVSYMIAIPSPSAYPSPAPIRSSYSVGDLQKGVSFTDSFVVNTGPWYIMFSKTELQTRFPFTELHLSAAKNLIGVRYDASTSSWKIDRGLYPDLPDPEISFTPAEGDRLLAEVNFQTGSIQSFKNSMDNLYGIPSGFSEGDLEFYVNMWNGGANMYEVWVQGTYFVA